MKGPAWYTADRGLIVADGDPRSAFLAAGPGDDVPTDVPWDLGGEPEPEKPVAHDEPTVDEKPLAAPAKKPARNQAAKSKG